METCNGTRRGEVSCHLELFVLCHFDLADLSLIAHMVLMAHDVVPFLLTSLMAIVVLMTG